MEQKIVCFGEVMMRLKTPQHQKYIQSLPGTLEATFGGAESNVAVSLAILGRGGACFVSALPQHEIAEACIQKLRGIGVNTNYIHRTSLGRLGVYYLESGANQRPSKVIYDREYSSVALTPLTAYNWDEIFRDASVFHVTGITPALSKNAADTVLHAISQAKEQNMYTFCDLNFRKKLWKWEDNTQPKELARKTMAKILPYVDVLIANEEDCSDVLNIHASNTNIEDGTINHKGYIPVAREIAAKYPNIQTIAITLRESISASHNNWGAMLYHAKSENAFFAPLKDAVYTPYQITNVVDRVGGGDSFAAGLIYALTDESLSAPSDALAFAVASSCLAHSIEGDFNFATKEEALSLAQGNASGRVQR